GVCLDLGDGTGYCGLTCTVGDSVPAAQKCRGRIDVGCAALNGTSGAACFPACTSDAGCGAGLHCNYGTGLCQSSAPTGDPMGKACDPNGPNTCAGYCTCTNAACTTGACSGNCTIGSMTFSCGEKEGTGICALTFSMNPGDGDMGACMGDCM